MTNSRGIGLNKCDYEFAADQRWCRTPHQLHFIDETQELVTNYEGDFDHEEDVASPVDWNRSRHSTPEHVTAPVSTSLSRIDDINGVQRSDHDLRNTPTKFGSQPARPEAPSSFDTSPGHSGTFILSPASTSSLRQHDSFSGPLDSLHIAGDQSTPVGGNLSSLSPTVSRDSAFNVVASPTTESLARIYLDTPIWPLQEREEAILMRYFVENLSRCFDLCDPDRHFALVVPHRAAVCPILLNAIFACSAKHLSRVSDFDPYVSDRYHQECLRHLIPKLNDSAAVMDENLLAATVILRFLEEVQGEISALLCEFAPGRVEYG